MATKHNVEHLMSRLERSIRENWDRPAVTDYRKETFTYADLGREIEKLHILFRECGVSKGDKISLCARNSARWAIVYWAVFSYEAVIVPILVDFRPEDMSHLVDHSDSVLLFTEKAAWSKIDPSQIPGLKAAIDTNNYSVLYDRDQDVSPVMESLDEVFKAEFPDGFSKENVHYPSEDFDRLAVISYTSGTTSAPKGVMLSAMNISANIDFGQKTIPCVAGDTVVSMLPMAHLYGLSFEMMYPLTGGCHVYFLGKVPTPQLLLQAFSEVKPFLIVTVPLVMEKIFKKNVFPVVDKFYMKILLSIPGIRQLIFAGIHKKLMAAFGGNVIEMTIGGAAINRRVERLMKASGMPYMVGYGMTECAPLVGYSRWMTFKFRSCGRVTPGMEIRIDSANQNKIVGEIQVKGVNVMMGYYKNPIATEAAFTNDGWLRTGDLGIIDRKGNIFLRGRSKNMILSANGQNIYPEEIEDILNGLPYVAESLIVSRDKKLFGLVVPDFDGLKADGRELSELDSIMEENRTLLNAEMPSYSKVIKFEIQQEPFEKTPKKSIKRFLYK